MEQTRLLIAIVLSFGVFFLWSIFVTPKVPENKPETTQITEAKPTPGQDTLKGREAPANQAAAPAVMEPAKIPPAPSGQEVRNIVVDTPLYRMVLSERGGAVVGMLLKDYTETVSPNSPKKQLVPPGLNGGTVLSELNGGNGAGVGKEAFYQLESPLNQVELKNRKETVRFVHDDPSGVQIVKAYTFDPDTYMVGLDVTVHNGSGQPLEKNVELVLREPKNTEVSRYGFEGPSALVNGKLQQIKPADIKKESGIDGKVQWIAIESRYFMESIVMAKPTDARLVPSYNGDDQQNQLIINGINLVPRQSQTVNMQLFMGPKSLSLLRSLNNNLDKAINFGWFDFIAKPCLWFMNFIYRFIPNYGVAIIILTILTRLAFWPLAAKSYKSMGGMRKLQPLMQEIRVKYKDDKARMNQELMALYKTYKINPMGGCLPMLIQLPVFFALYRMLYEAIELRHAPFFGWINDLSAPDRLFHFNFAIPFMQPPYGIPVLTLLMGATMLLQQKMTPAPGDPAQAKMMMIMPVVFTVIFINFPAGLTLYWLVGNLISMAQQYYTQKKLA